MGRKQKKSLTGKEIHCCNDFKEKRLRCGMNQKEWTEAISISPGLVKGIESHMRKCTPGTEEKVKNYMKQFHAAPDTPDTRSLEKRILCDIFLTHMDRTGKKEAAYYADPCIRSIQKILSAADGLETTDEQKLYFQYLAMFFNMFAIASNETTRAITDGLDVLDIAGKLHPGFIKKLAKSYKTAKENLVSKNEMEAKQISIFDDMDNT